MVRETAPYQERCELARRMSGGLVVTLWWDEQSTDVAVTVTQGDRGAFQVVVDGSKALHAFYHPFAAAAAAAAGRRVRGAAA
ncbi:hypothetical protein GCM10009798_40470 [Nocardioides panacihumi]|uniref:KTSC domain-containing protein n=2 Tax=Nocardioides panacihumi TaxID=400774 RepID=A0ABN2RUU8_9ACTN